MSDEKRPWGPVVREIMDDKEFMSQFPNGVDASELFDELVERGSNVATSASVIDIVDYMNEMYGAG